MTEEGSKPTSARPGKAGRIDYDKWHKVTNELVDDVDKEEQEEIEAQKKALGLDGKYARSASEAEERKKFEEVQKAKKALDNYQKRESQMKEDLKELLGPVPPAGENQEKVEESKSTEEKTIRITRDMLDAGKRVVSITDTSGASQKDTIVLTQDLSLLESKMKANTSSALTPKSYDGDSENDVKVPEQEQVRSIYGIIKCFISNVHNCTILIKCKVITGAIEMNHCSNVVVKIEKEATVATVQADLCEDITIEFRDAPSGKNSTLPGQKKMFWGEDSEDRIFHAGVSNMLVKVIRDDFVETERMCDYMADGAKKVGNASEKEYQFVTAVVNGELLTEAVIRAGATTGSNARAMTQRELDAEKIKREKAADMAEEMAKNMIKFKEPGKEVTKVDPTPVETVNDGDNEIEEVYGSMSQEEVKQIVSECETNKARGNEAFGSGEYAQAILLYTLALDKANELPDASDKDATKQLFPRDVTLSNRAACFLKLGEHEKAEADAKNAVEINPSNVKANFRQGLALHAMGKYGDAIPVLAKAHDLEPKNKQIKQALQFAEVRMTQEMRKRMEG